MFDELISMLGSTLIEIPVPAYLFFLYPAQWNSTFACVKGDDFWSNVSLSNLL